MQILASSQKIVAFLSFFFFASLADAFSLSTASSLWSKRTGMGDCGTTVDEKVSSSQSSIKAVIFDLDGTLLDTEGLADRAILDAFGESLPADTRAKLRVEGDRLPWELKRKILGLRGSEWIPMVVDYAQKRWGVSETVATCPTGSNVGDDPKSFSAGLPPPPPVNEFWQRWESGLNALCCDVEACVAAKETVQKLAKLGIPLALATSSRHSSVQEKRKKHEDMFQHIPIVVTGDDPRIKNGKPAPDIFVEAARRLGVAPAHCLVVEDALTGVQAAKAAGCWVIAVPDPRMDKAVFEAAADEVLNNLWEFNGKRWGFKLNMREPRDGRVENQKQYAEMTPA